jgi:dsDNA-specific endonuclease/ATPase MutS2
MAAKKISLPKSTSESVAKKVVIAQKKANVEIKKNKKEAEAKIKELKKQSIVKKKK